MIHKVKAIHKRKWHLFYKLFGKKNNILAVQSIIQRLNLSIAEHLRLLKKLEKTQEQKRLLNNFKKTLEQQKKMLSKAKITKIASRAYKDAVASMEDEAILLLKKEEHLISKLGNGHFAAKPKMIKLSKRQAEQAARIIFAINKTIRQAGNVVGNRKEVQKTTKLLLKQLARLQHTEVYGYMKEDADKIRKAAKQIMQNPSETKLKQMLAGIYLVVPFTFDATGAVIVLRYAAKYANAKSKGIKKRIKSIRDRRKQKLRLFE